jgi:hypothetical protein
VPAFNTFFSKHTNRQNLFTNHIADGTIIW